MTNLKYFAISYDGKNDVYDNSIETPESLAEFYCENQHDDCFDFDDETEISTLNRPMTDSDWLDMIDGSVISKDEAVQMLALEGWNDCLTGLSEEIAVARADPEFLEIKAGVEKAMLLDGWEIDHAANNSVYFTKSEGLGTSNYNLTKVRFSNHELGQNAEGIDQTGGASTSVCFEEGQTVEEIVSALLGEDPEFSFEELELLKTKAKNGSEEDQIDLGWRYRNGEGVPQDFAEAGKWYMLAAHQGNAPAERHLDHMFDTSELDPETSEAKTYLKRRADTELDFRRAAESGDASAQFKLGYKNNYGEGVPQDWAEALKWYRRAAEQGNVEAQNKLGYMYEKGEGVPSDYAEAAKWYELAAEQGDAKAQTTLGYMYRDGIGVPQDWVAALKWLNLAAEQGFANAQYTLGVMYEFGAGVTSNKYTAAKWYKQAADQGHYYAQSNLNSTTMQRLA